MVSLLILRRLRNELESCANNEKFKGVEEEIEARSEENQKVPIFDLSEESFSDPDASKAQHLWPLGLRNICVKKR
jgi:hypothetical protein